MDSMENAVSYGVEVLDSDPYWRDRINLDYLDLSENDCCVLGQLFEGDLQAGMEALGIADLGSYGFDLPIRARIKCSESLNTAAAEVEAFDALTDLWRYELTRYA